jgi:NO-binding membrane sensor protein with MHYT domain
MLWIRVWRWWYELVAVVVIVLAALIIYLGKPSGYDLDMTGLILIVAVVGVILGLLASSYRKYRQQTGAGK